MAFHHGLVEKTSCGNNYQLKFNYRQEGPTRNSKLQKFRAANGGSDENEIS